MPSRYPLFIVISPVFAFLAIWIGVAAEATAAGHPPIGKRSYVIDQKDPYAPVKIEATGAKAKVVLKDPVSPLGAVELKPIRKAPKQVAVAQPAPPARVGNLRFGKLNVSGHVRQPRVEFSRDVLPVDRADDLDVPEFFQKVFEPAQDDSF